VSGSKYNIAIRSVDRHLSRQLVGFQADAGRRSRFSGNCVGARAPLTGYSKFTARYSAFPIFLHVYLSLYHTQAHKKGRCCMLLRKSISRALVNYRASCSPPVVMKTLGYAKSMSFVQLGRTSHCCINSCICRSVLFCADHMDTNCHSSSLLHSDHVILHVSSRSHTWHFAS
jgi:hypothetical protein